MTVSRIAMMFLAFGPGAALAQSTELPAPRQAQPIDYPLLAPARAAGMASSGSLSVTPVPVRPDSSPAATAAAEEKASPYYSHDAVTQEQIDAFNETMRMQMPMSPEMVRRSIALYDEVQRAMLDKPQPEIIIDSVLMTLEPGETPPLIYLSSDIASVIGFYDSTGQPWPIKEFVIGNGGKFEAMPLGAGANSFTIKSLVPFSFSNVVVTLEGESKPATINLKVSDSAVHQRRDIIITKEGPKALHVVDTTSPDQILAAQKGPDGTPISKEAGNKFLVTAISGVDMPDSAVPVTVTGINARAWMLGDSIFIRTRYPLAAPQPLNFLAGPDGVMIYEIKSTPTALFDVGGSMVRADIDLP